MAEWLKAPHSKCGILERVSGVQILSSPLINNFNLLTMNNFSSITLSKNKITYLTLFVSLFVVAYFAPFLKQQLITGTLVNATLFITVSLLGTRAGTIMAMVPSLIALAVGTLPTPLAPMLPFIILSNILLIIVFKNLEKKYFLAITMASAFKFAFLFLSSSIIINLLLKKELAQNIIIMMSWPQLITALLGGLLAYLTLKYLPKK